MSTVQEYALPKFAMAHVQDPIGYKPGLYHYVLFLEQMRKVSRLQRRLGAAHRKMERYAAKYAAGDRDWPEVTRQDELRDNPDAVPTVGERLRVMMWGHE